MAVVNPKVLLFNAAFLPQFLSGQGSAAAQLLVVSGVFLTVILLGDLLWFLFASTARRAMARVGHLRNRMTAVFLAGASLGLALTKRGS